MHSDIAQYLKVIVKWHTNLCERKIAKYKRVFLPYLELSDNDFDFLEDFREEIVSDVEDNIFDE